MLPPNPFRPTKIEHDKDPVFLLSSNAREIPSNFKNVHVSGSRGSGKTTLLRSLRTAEIRSNQTLRAQYGKATFDWFGVYLQFNRTLQSLMVASAKAIALSMSDQSGGFSSSEATEFRIFQSYLEITILAAFIDDLIEVSDRRDIFLTSAVEREVTTDILSRLGVQEGEWDIYAVRRELSRCRSSFSALPTPSSARALTSLLDAFAPGDLLGSAAAIAAGLRGQLVRKNVPIRLMVLIDDAESLTADQQAILNTILKQVEGRVKFVVASIAGQYDPNSTALPNTVLNNDDYTAIVLDEESQSDFRSFCERVTDLRLKHYYQMAAGEKAPLLPSFSLRTTLGDFKANELIADAIAGSQSIQVQRWRSEVEATRERLRNVIGRRNWRKFSVDDGQTPFVEHELLRLLKIDIERLATAAHQDAVAKVIDRKQVGALLYIVHRVLPIHTVPYAGAEVVVGLATGRIRDYLDIMAEIYDSTIRDYDPTWRIAGIPNVRHIAHFVQRDRAVRPELQRNGVLGASETKWLVLENYTVKSSFNIPLVVAGLAELTSKLQLPKADYGFISQPDRGVFAFDPENLDTILEARKAEVRSDEIVRALQRAGFIRVLASRTKSTTGFQPRNLETFHLHRRLFPRLGISYRGPYEQFRLSEQALSSLVLGTDIVPARWAEEVLRAVPTEDAPTQEQFRL